MIEFFPELEDGADFVFEQNHGRYLLLFERELRALATKLGVRCPKDFDGFIEVQNAIAARGELTPQQWASAYADGLEDATPVWFDPADALPDMQALGAAVRQQLAATNDEDLEILADALDLLVVALEAAADRQTRFYMIMA